MNKLQTIIVFSCIFILNVSLTKARYGDDNDDNDPCKSKRECERTLAQRERKFDNNEFQKVLEGIHKTNFTSDQERQTKFVSILSVHNWKISDYSYLFSVPNINLQQVISITHYADGNWWQDLLNPTFRAFFKTELLIKDIDYNIKKTKPYKNWIKEFVSWSKKSSTNKCSYEVVKNVLEIYKELNEKLELENKLFDLKYIQRPLTDNTSHIIYDYICKNNDYELNVFRLLLNSRILDMYATTSTNVSTKLWDFKSLLHFVKKHAIEGNLSPFVEELIKISFKLNINEKTLNNLIVELKSQSELSHAAKSLKLISEKVNGQCNLVELQNIINTAKDFFNLFTNNAEDATDNIQLVLNNIQAGPLSVINNSLKISFEKIKSKKRY